MFVGTHKDKKKKKKMEKRVETKVGIRSKKISRKRARMLNLERQNKLARKTR